MFNFFFFFENRAVYEMDQNMIEPDRPHTHTHNT